VTKWRKSVWWRVAQFVALALAIGGARAQTASPGTLNLSGKVIGGSGKYVIYVALWDAQTFLGRPVRQLRLERGTTPEFHFQVPPGHWAVSAFEDLNDNGILDMGHFGPKEPSGFWRPFHAWRKPRFEDVESLIDKDTPNADIKFR
jgi:uncharacterized protein (DUF2141 family)